MCSLHATSSIHGTHRVGLFQRFRMPAGALRLPHGALHRGPSCGASSITSSNQFVLPTSQLISWNESVALVVLYVLYILLVIKWDALLPYIRREPTGGKKGPRVGHAPHKDCSRRRVVVVYHRY